MLCSRNVVSTMWSNFVLCRPSNGFVIGTGEQLDSCSFFDEAWAVSYYSYSVSELSIRMTEHRVLRYGHGSPEPYHFSKIRSIFSSIFFFLVIHGQRFMRFCEYKQKRLPSFATNSRYWQCGVGGAQQLVGQLRSIKRWNGGVGGKGAPRWGSCAAPWWPKPRVVQRLALRQYFGKHFLVLEDYSPVCTS